MSINSVQYFIVVKNCSTIWTVSSSRMSIASVGTRRAFLDPVSIMVIEVHLETKDSALAPPKSKGANWVRSWFISKVTIGVSGVRVITASCVVATSRQASSQVLSSLEL